MARFAGGVLVGALAVAIAVLLSVSAHAGCPGGRSRHGSGSCGAVRPSGNRAAALVANPAGVAGRMPQPLAAAGQMPQPLAAAGSDRCSLTVSSAAAAEAGVLAGSGGAVVCLTAGTYAGLDLSGAHSGYVIVQPVPGQTVTITAGVRDSHANEVAVYAEPGATHLIVHGFLVRGEMELAPGASAIRIDHNDITGGPFGVELDSVNCRTANAPTWSGCAPEPKITDVIISGNRIHDIGGPAGGDAINVNNYANLRVTGNDLYGMIEGGNHTDCLQSTFGGSGLVFDHNYEHDNNCQGLFTKDGDVTDAVIYDNLFVRDQVSHQPEGNLDIFNVYRLILRNNTSLPDTADILRDQGSAQPPRATVDRNVFDTFADGCCAERATFALTEDANVFLHRPLSFRPARDDRIGLPAFIDPGTDDYRLAHNPDRIGIDWRPADQHYGP
jgi:hypothetical protein